MIMSNACKNQSVFAVTLSHIQKSLHSRVGHVCRGWHNDGESGKI